jgi:hypothetical protein
MRDRIGYETLLPLPFMSKAIPNIAHDLMRYTSDNPEAADTLEGIAAWWLGGRYPLPEVRKILAALVEQGLFVEVEGKDLQTIFRRSGGGAR